MNLWNRRKAAVIFVLMVLIVGTTLYWKETPRQNKAPLDPEAVMTKQREQKALPSSCPVSGAVGVPGGLATCTVAQSRPMPSARQAA